MVTKLEDILFAGLSWPFPDKLQWLKIIDTLDENYWFNDKYRKCDLLPLFTRLGCYREGHTGNIGDTEQMQWTPFTPLDFQEFLDKFVLQFLYPKPRIYLIRTFPGQSMSEHIDCDRKVFGSLQLKIRLNITGLTSDLYFITESGKLYIPDYEGFFIMDGSWPHGLKNQSENIRYTLALGAPWTGKDIDQKYLRKIVYKKKSIFPFNYEIFFEN